MNVILQLQLQLGAITAQVTQKRKAIDHASYTDWTVTGKTFISSFLLSLCRRATACALFHGLILYLFPQQDSIQNYLEKLQKEQTKPVDALTTLCLCTLSASLPMCADSQAVPDDHPIGWLFRTSDETKVPDSYCIFVPRDHVSEHKPRLPRLVHVAVSTMKESCSAECGLPQLRSVVAVASVSI